MADPIFVNCPKGVWTKVAAGLSTGSILPLTSIGSPTLTPMYTYRVNNGGSPTDLTEGYPLTGDATIPANSDIYVLYTKVDGRVRVDA